jgi:putative ABC transport system substrate-binding protein
MRREAANSGRKVGVFGLTLCALLTASYGFARAQHTAKLRTVGFLSHAGHPPAAYQIFRQSLRDLGYLEGKNITIQHLTAVDGSLAEKANALVRLNPDVIVTTGGASTRPVQQATKTIPIVFTSSGDPIEGGFIDTLARPGKNLTGITFLAYELVGKRVELLKEADPKVSRMAVIANPAHPGEQRELMQTQTTARSLGVVIDHHRVQSKADYAAAFEAIRKDKASGILVFPETTTLANIQPITEFSAKHFMPSMFGWREYVEGGGLMAYGPNRAESYRRIAAFVDKILRGAKPADLPTELPLRFELVINLKTAKQIGLTIPPNVLARADRVIR